MAATVSQWNPTGSETNCMACVARYLHYQLLGTWVDAEKSRVLEWQSEPETIDGSAPTLTMQKRMAIGRTKSIIESVGLIEVDRHDAYVGRYSYPKGHYAVIGYDKGHVIYGYVEEDGQNFTTLYCPQSDSEYPLSRLGGRALAMRFRVG
jgi:hypothetical protein